MVMEVVQEDFGDGSMQCTDHPYKNNTPGGICAFCLQEKLGKLVSSSFPIAVFPSSSSSPSPSPSFRSDHFTTTTTTTATSSIVPFQTNLSSNLSNVHNNNNDYHHHHYNYFRKSKIPFLLTQRKKKKDPSLASDNSNSIIFKRSKSSATPRRGAHFMEAKDIDDLSLQKRRFWSFLHLSKHSSTKKLPELKEIGYPSSSSSVKSGSFSQQRSRKKEEMVVVEENESPDQVSFDRKVSRSRSVGCGSRSFSGDFFERISTGFGDCTLRRVESQREGKTRNRHGGGGGGQDCIKERVKCGGLFSGFMITSSSSSSSSSSNWVSSSTEDNNNVSAKASAAAAAAAVAGRLAHGRNKSWGWAFASPMRAFGKPSTKKDAAAAAAANKNIGPNLAAIPSLLAVRS